jgi:hypothetical protein
MVERNLDIILMIFSNLLVSDSNFSVVINFMSDAINNCVSTSYAEPVAISRNLEKSLFEFLELPSAILDGIETDALLNWLVKPNLSLSGNELVTA